MKILLAKNAGYCFGVRDAVNMAYDTAEEYGDVYMLGHIVHNENVVDDLDKAGAKVVDSLDDVPNGRPVLLRAHGTHVDTWEEAKKKNGHIVDEDKFLDSITERQDLCINMTKMTSEEILQEITKGAKRLNINLDLKLDESKLVKTGGYKKVNDAGGFGGKLKRNENDFSFNYSQSTFDEAKTGD